jgi:hypothetical protein
MVTKMIAALAAALVLASASVALAEQADNSDRARARQDGNPQYSTTVQGHDRADRHDAW